MDDLISRQAAIDLWDKYHPYIATEAMEYDRELRALPSARPERKKGKWIITDIDIINRVWHCNCSECGEDPLHFVSGTEDWWLNKLPDYCPSCGAEMEKTDE